MIYLSLIYLSFTAMTCWSVGTKPMNCDSGPVPLVSKVELVSNRTRTGWIHSHQSLHFIADNQIVLLSFFSPPSSLLPSHSLASVWQRETVDTNHLHCPLSVSHCRHWPRGLCRLFLRIPLAARCFLQWLVLTTGCQLVWPVSCVGFLLSGQLSVPACFRPSFAPLSRPRASKTEMPVVTYFGKWRKRICSREGIWFVRNIQTI